MEAVEPVTTEEVVAVIARLPTGKAPGTSGVPNEYLKLLGRPLAAALAALTQGCWDWGYFPKVFKTARTVVPRKPGKTDYQDPEAWQPIAFLEALGKVVEAVSAGRVRSRHHYCRRRMSR